jgi:hypothetical protein
MDGALPTAKSVRLIDEREKLRRVVEERGLCGLANDTKWDEFITGVRAHTDWRPSYRFKSIDGPVSGWDVEWSYHLPFPLLCVEWLDLAHLQTVRESGQVAQVINHSGWIEDLLRAAGLDFRTGAAMIRVFGYSPRSLELFDV